MGECQYVIPNSDIQEVVRPTKNADHRLSSKDQVIQIKDVVYPLIDLAKEIGVTMDPRYFPVKTRAETLQPASKTVVIIRSNNKLFALLVDEIISQQRVVHKALGPEVRSFQAAAGATILGDGSVALILELTNLLTEGSLAA